MRFQGEPFYLLSYEDGTFSIPLSLPRAREVRNTFLTKPPVIMQAILIGQVKPDSADLAGLKLVLSDMLNAQTNAIRLLS